ncbi:MAG: carbohydrate kinase family protein [Anaerolineae bacterium]|jgi:sulfofructose kinase
MESKHQFDVIGLGVSVVDVVTRVDHFPAQEEVQHASAAAVQGGGPVATAIVTLARLGARVAMLDAVGDDWRGDLIREGFQREGVCTDYLKQVAGCTSSIASILVRQRDGARSIVFAPGTAPELSAAAVPRDLITSARILHLNGRHWEACLQACQHARESNVQVSFDGGAHRYRPELRQLVPLTDVCIVARDFAEHYTRETDIRKAAERLLEEGPGLVVITDGTRGSWIYPREGRPFHQPAYLLPPVVDTTGCGDSYHGAFLFGRLKGWDLEKTAALASAVAALNSQHLGGRSGLPSLEQVTSFLSIQGE